MKKKLFVLTVLFLFGFTMVSCDFLFTTTIANTEETTSLSTSTRETTVISSTEISVSTTETTISTNTTEMTTTEIVTETTTTELTTFETTTTEQTTTTEETTTTASTSEPFIPTGYSLLQDELEYVGIPSTGDSKVLVFAVDFSDYPSYTSDITLQDLDIAFNGESSELAYESVNSYYQKSSYGKLNITADIYGFYRASEPSTYYDEEYYKYWAIDPITGEWLYDESEVTPADSDLIYEVLSYYDDQIDYSDYDANNDGYIDGIYIIYTTPVDSGDSDLWWAFQNYYAYYGDTFDGVEPLYYTWAGTDFFTEDGEDINARTVIHETGHMMGLDDYYDYDDWDNFNSGGLGGADMMDSAYGDHGPFSKILMGWVTPLVVEESMTVDILPFVSSGQVILLIDEWNGTIFDEYILISFFTPEDLNDENSGYTYGISGVIMYHVSAKIGNGYLDDSAYYTIFNYNNTDTEHKLIDIIEADMNDYIDRFTTIQDGDLFQEGDCLGGNIYALYKWYNNQYIAVDVLIEEISEDTVTIRFTF